MTTLKDRQQILSIIAEGSNNGARKAKICEIIGMPIRTIQRWEKNISGDRRPNAERKSSIALSDAEKNKIVEICTNNEYKDLTPNEIVPIIAEKGLYCGSESSFYRVLKERGLLHHRSESKPPRSREAPAELKAVGPCQVWSWDITYLKTPVQGIFFYLYLFMDVWSRKIVGWTIEDFEDGQIASDIISKICQENGISSIYLHSDNGGPMTCGTMLATLERLGVVPSFSRARVSNDNPYSESLFKTLKYVPAYPKVFKSKEAARNWVSIFVDWYNNEHHHSGIKFVTPLERHNGKDIEILEKRKKTYLLAKLKNPKRWSKNIKNWDHQKEVILNKKRLTVKVNEAA